MGVLYDSRTSQYTRHQGSMKWTGEAIKLFPASFVTVAFSPPRWTEQVAVFCPPSICCQWTETQASGACQKIRQRDHPLQWHRGLQCFLQQACVWRRGHEDCKPPQWPLHQIWHIDGLPEKSICLQGKSRSYPNAGLFRVWIETLRSEAPQVLTLVLQPCGTHTPCIHCWPFS